MWYIKDAKPKGENETVMFRLYRSQRSVAPLNLRQEETPMYSDEEPFHFVACHTGRDKIARILYVAAGID